MNKALLLLALVVMSATVHAQWQLQLTRDGNWITTSTANAHQLIVGDSQEGAHFLLAMTISAEEPPLLNHAYLTVDRFEPEPVQLRLLEKRPESRLFRINVSDEHRTRLIGRMKAGLTMRFGYETESSIQNFLQFTLIGFTAAWNDLHAGDQREPTPAD